MFNTLKVIKIVALFFILAGFATPSIDESRENVLVNLQMQSEQLLSVYSKQNGKLENSARHLANKISASRSEKMTRTQMFGLWLSYGDFYRQAAQEPEFASSDSKRVLIEMKAQLNMLEKNLNEKV